MFVDGRECVLIKSKPRVTHTGTNVALRCEFETVAFRDYQCYLDYETSSLRE